MRKVTQCFGGRAIELANRAIESGDTKRMGRAASFFEGLAKKLRCAARGEPETDSKSKRIADALRPILDRNPYIQAAELVRLTGANISTCLVWRRRYLVAKGLPPCPRGRPAL